MRLVPACQWRDRSSQFMPCSAVGRLATVRPIKRSGHVTVQRWIASRRPIASSGFGPARARVGLRARACIRVRAHVFVCVRVHTRVCVRACSCWISWLFCSSSVAIDSTSFFSANIGCCSTASADGRSCTRTQLQRRVCGVRWDNSRPLVSSTRMRLLARNGRMERAGTIAPGVCVCVRARARVCARVCVRVCLY
jgi:hypothetical protein